MSKNDFEIDSAAIEAREAELANLSDADIIERQIELEKIFLEMTEAVSNGKVRALIVSGPAGVGKSYGVEAILSKHNLLNKIAGRKDKYEVVKGSMSSVGLYAKLYEYSEKGNVVVFDDCDEVLTEPESLNLLKGALDSNERRFISWNKDSRLLRTESIPDRFEFCGSAIFITNIKFDFVRSKKLRAHLQALESRCHYIDLGMDTVREKMLRIQHIVDKAGMLDRYGFDDVTTKVILDFINDNRSKLGELSLRMVLKIADLRKTFPTTWQTMAKQTCMKPAKV